MVHIIRQSSFANSTNTEAKWMANTASSMGPWLHAARRFRFIAIACRSGFRVALLVPVRPHVDVAAAHAAFGADHARANLESLDPRQSVFANIACRSPAHRSQQVQSGSGLAS